MCFSVLAEKCKDIKKCIQVKFGKNKVNPEGKSFAQILAAKREVLDQVLFKTGKSPIVGKSKSREKVPQPSERKLIHPKEMTTKMNSPKIPSIEWEDFEDDIAPKPRRDLNENNILWNKEGSKAPTKVELSSMGDDIIKERIVESDMPSPKFKISTKVQGLAKNAVKGFILPRKHVINRLKVNQPTYSTRELREPIRTTETLY